VAPTVLCLMMGVASVVLAWLSRSHGHPTLVFATALPLAAIAAVGLVANRGYVLGLIESSGVTVWSFAGRRRFGPGEVEVAERGRLCVRVGCWRVPVPPEHEARELVMRLVRNQPPKASGRPSGPYRSREG